MAEVLLKSVWKEYGPVEAVRDLTLDCKDGEFLTILGPSGAGKTSTLKMIAGIEPVTRGDIFIDRRRVNDIPPSERDVAMAFETYALYAHMTVFNNLAFPLRAPIRASQYTSETISSKVREMARLLQIEELLGRMPDKLSGGQRQRVCLGRMLVRDPKVFLMDEPIAHLDAKLRHRLRGELRRIQKDLAATVIYATHDYLEALGMGDKVAIIDKGKLRQVGTPDDVYFRPVDTFVARLIGDPPMNFITCSILRKDDTLSLTAEGLEIALGERIKKIIELRDMDRDVILGVRPSDFMVSRSADSTYPIVSEIYVFEPLGPEGILTVRAGKQLLRVKTDSELDGAIGEVVRISVNNEAIYLFDRKSEKNILL